MIRPYLIGSAITLVILAIAYGVWIYRANKDLREKNEDLKTQVEHDGLLKEDENLSDAELSDRLHNALDEKLGTKPPKPNA